MGLYALEELTRKWQHEQLTAEQMIGQLLQHVGVLYERVRLLERRRAARGMEHGPDSRADGQPGSRTQRRKDAEAQRE